MPNHHHMIVDISRQAGNKENHLGFLMGRFKGALAKKRPVIHVCPQGIPAECELSAEQLALAERRLLFLSPNRMLVAQIDGLHQEGRE